ncbi:MAG TPA: SDR family NAD(P)-dependent oxidoreductase [Acidimicrobiales bacterium]|nr:SDR family NAD(P)-dependent oxidoreductase [Acidimicrobiales bacterium]
MNAAVVVVTGASEGIGAAGARALAAQGHQVVPVGRSAEKTRAIAAEVGNEGHVADFADLARVRALAAALAERYPRIDVLVNNAGLIAGNQRTVTGDGHELTWQVNHLAPFLLTVSLHDQLVAAGGRVITTSSAAGAARGARVVLDDLDAERRYNALRAYQASKLANVLFTRELARRWGPQGVSAAAFHPGMVRTRWGHAGPASVRLAVRSPLRRTMRSPEQGADTLVWLAIADPGTEWTSGGYYHDRKPARPSPLADDVKLAGELWARSESATGVAG